MSLVDLCDPSVCIIIVEIKSNVYVSVTNQSVQMLSDFWFKFIMHLKNSWINLYCNTQVMQFLDNFSCQLSIFAFARNVIFLENICLYGLNSLVPGLFLLLPALQSFFPNEM